MMKIRCKFLFMIVFVISSFLFLNKTGIVKATSTYSATVFNPENASCSLYKGSSGYCYYKDKNLNSYVPSVIWLDTGDVVTVHPENRIPTNNKNVCSTDYVYTDFYFASKSTTYHGYYCSANLKSDDDVNNMLTEELKTEFKTAGFPESYWKDLAVLKTAHPNWNFKAIDTGLNFNDVILNQTYSNRSLLRGSMSNNYAYLSLGADSFDYKNNKFIPYDDITGTDPWYKANYDIIAYYVDPRNFLSDMYIFQFETLSYDSSIPDDRLKASISSIFGSDYLNKFTDDFLEAGKTSKVNPIYLASLSKEEVANGATPGTAVNGKYNGMYNFYNIGASSGKDPVYRGLTFASNKDASTLRPWDTEKKAIIGGATWIYNNYVATGQVTSYFKKFDVVYNYVLSIGGTPNHKNYTHQYMQNISAPSSEAATTYRSYNKNDMLGLSYTFYIPVYKNMPEIAGQPTKGGWPNNYLSSLIINSSNVVDFDGAVEVYNYNLDINNPEIKIEAKVVDSRAKVSGTGTFKISSNTTKTITVAAENGDIKKYKIKITLTGNKVEAPIDIVTTLNKAGIKNGNRFLSGFALKSDISLIKKKIVAANKDAVVILKDAKDKEKNSGIVKTGDKVTITVGKETKTYEIVIYGDVNGDGEILASDYKMIKDTIMGTTKLWGPYEEAAHVGKDSKILASDYKRIKDYIMGTGVIEQ